LQLRVSSADHAGELREFRHKDDDIDGKLDVREGLWFTSLKDEVLKRRTK